MVGLLALVTGCAAASPPPPTSARHALLGAALPTFTRQTLQGGTVSTGALRGRVVVVEVAASYCKSCPERLREALALRREHPEVVILVINEDERESTARAFLAPFAELTAVHDRQQVLLGRLRVPSMPFAFVADRAGVIRFVLDEEAPPGALEGAVNALRE